MPTSTFPREGAAAAWRAYLIPLAALLSAFLLTFLIHRSFETVLEVAAPAFLIACVVAALFGVVHLKASVRRARRRILDYPEIAAAVDELAMGVCPPDLDVGRTWRLLEITRSLTVTRSGAEQASVRRGLRTCGVWRPVAARAQSAHRKWQRVRALQDLGWLGASEALPVVYRALADADDDIAWAALVALGGMDEDLPYIVLLELLDDGRFAASRVAQVLDASRHPRPVPLLSARVHASGNSALFWIAFLLGRSTDTAAAAPLIELSTHASPDVRASTAEALGRIGDRSAIAVLTRMVHDDAWFVRLHACRSLADLSATEAVPVIRTATRDPSWWVQQSAAEALRRLGGEIA